MKTGDKVRVLRRGKGWTQEQLAEAIGYSKQYISEIERGNKDCYPLLRKLAQALDVSCQKLLND